MKLFDDPDDRALARIDEIMDLIGEVRVGLGRIEEKVDRLRVEGDAIAEDLRTKDEVIANLRVRDAYIAGGAAVAAFIGGPLIVWLFSRFGGG